MLRLGCLFLACALIAVPLLFDLRAVSATDVASVLFFRFEATFKCMEAL